MEMEKHQNEFIDIYKKRHKNKIYSSWYILVATFFGTLNCIFSNNSNIKYMVFLQLLIIVFLLMMKKVKKAFIYHSIFMITSINFHNDLKLLIQGYSTIYNYSKLKLFGNLSFSYLIILLVFIYSLFIKKSVINLKNRKLKNFIKIFILLFLTSFSTGLVGLVIDNYDLLNFFQGLLYFLHILLDLYFLAKFFDVKEIKVLKKLVYSLLITAILVPIVCSIFGFTGSYGGVKKLASLDIYGYTPILVLLLLSKKNYFIGILGLISIYMGRDIYNGKEILSASFVLVIFLFRTVKLAFSKIYWKRKRAFLILQFIVIGIIAIGKTVMDKVGDSKLLKLKFEQFWSLFSIYKNFDTLPNSPKIRVIQLINIFLEYMRKPYMLIFGLGNGSYYDDPYKLFYTVKMSVGAYSEKELFTRRFFYTHDTFSTVLKQHGIFGIYFLIKWLLYFWKNIKYERLAIVPFLWLGLVYGFNNYQVILFAMINAFIIFLEYQKRVKE